MNTFHLRARHYRYNAIRRQQEREQALARQVAKLTAENEALKCLLRPRNSRITNTRQALAALQPLERPSQAAALVADHNGPTIYWIAVHRFGVDGKLAGQILAQHPQDWPAALTALDPHVF